MKTTWRIGLITAVCLCYVLKTCAAHPDERASEDHRLPYIRPKGNGLMDEDVAQSAGKTVNMRHRSFCEIIRGRCLSMDEPCQGRKAYRLCDQPSMVCCKKAWSVL